MKKIILTSCIILFASCISFSQTWQELDSLREVYQEKASYDTAFVYAEKAMLQADKEFGKIDSNYSTALNNLAALYYKKGNYSKAEPLFIESKNIDKEVFGEKHLDYALSLDNLAVLYEKMGNYEKAEPLQIKAKNIRKEVLGKKHTDYARSLNNLALLYHKMGNYSKAEPLFIESKNIWKEVLGKKHSLYATSLNNLAALYYYMGNYEKSKPLYIEAKNICKEVLGEKHPSYALSLNNLAALYDEIGNYEKAEPLYFEAKNIWKEVLGEKHPDYSRSLNNLAVLYREIGNYSKAEPLLIEAKNIWKEVLGEKHPDYAISLNNLAILYDKMGNYYKAEFLYIENNKIINHNIRQNSTFLSEKEKEKYFKTVSSDFEEFNSFALKRKQQNPAIVNYVYNNALQNKGLLLKSSAGMRQTVLNSGDTALINTYNNWLNLKKELSKLYSQAKDKRQKNTAVLEEKANTLEKELTRKSQAFRDYKKVEQLAWEKVQENLQTNEAAIEFVHFRYRDKKWTDTTFYCALVNRPGYKSPVMVKLFEEKELVAILEKFGGNNLNYIKDIYGTQAEKQTKLYELIWQPIDSLLQDVHTVYISPTGLLHKISFSAINTPDNQYLSDKFNINVQSTTGKVALPETFNLDKDLTAGIFGGIQYNSDSTNTEIWKYLEGTKSEADKIEKIFRKKKIQVTRLTGKEAKESSFKELAANTEILHIATHGFFYPDPEKIEKEKEIEYGDIAFRGGSSGFGVESFVNNEDPLMRTGLVFAGANDVWIRTQKSEGEDGVLTAYEVSNLNLQNTQLVVMSACETGLGDIKGSEGVYGLQRAFKMAGVNFLIMSLWQVPDKETEEFMTTFYTKLLKQKDIKKAFSETQSEMRKKYAPYFWAAFVLVE